MKVRDIRKSSSVPLQTVTPDHTVREAVEVLCRFNIGALPVLDIEGSLVGIISERDVLRLCCRDDGPAMLSTRVRDVMTREVVVAVPDDSVEYVMRVMTERRVRHLPVLEDHNLVAIVSIGDVVKAQHDEKDTEIRYLRDYMQGALA
ncbi:MAG TPA: CBS domain-containing protein [Candidatus Binatia bacterium]|jgi:CBS domain-containing protein